MAPVNFNYNIWIVFQADIDPYTDPYQNLKDDHYTDYTNFDEPINENKMRDEIQMQFSVTKSFLHSYSILHWPFPF